MTDVNAGSVWQVDIAQLKLAKPCGVPIKRWLLTMLPSYPISGFRSLTFES